jgi:hypothetical protein
MAMPLRKKLFLLIIVGGSLYFLLSQHIIIIKGNPRDIRLLKKSTFTLEYTFFSTQGKTNKQILSIDVLREDGIGEILIEEGLMSAEEERRILKGLKLEAG